MADPAQVPSPRLRVVIVDADDRVRESLAGILDACAIERVEVLGTAGDAATALALLTATRPRVVILDPRLPDLDGAVAFIRAARAALPEVCILALSWSDAMGHAALEAGADGYVRKTYRSSELVAAVIATTDACS